jgi:signal transduction histidine kinase
LAWVRSWPPATQDGVLVAVILAVQVLALTSSVKDTIPAGIQTRPVDAGAYVIVVASTLPLLLRRRYPVLALLAAIAGLLAYGQLAYDAAYTGYPVVVALYSVVVYRGLRIGVLSGAGTFLALQLTYVLADLDRPPVSSVLDLLVVATGIALGDGTRNRIAADEANQARLEQMAVEQERRAEEAVLEERTRIARELHDLVAHSMSVIAVQAGVGGHLIDQDPARAKSALSTIEQTSRQALVEMRRMLGVLRTGPDEPAELGPQPGLDDLEPLLDQAREAGLQVDLTVLGAHRALEPGVDLSAYRIVQEALTNAVKYAGPARVEVVLEYRRGSIAITVEDNGRGASVATGGRRGLGLVGMRERAMVVGGTLESGPRSGGGFRVAAALPYTVDPPDHALDDPEADCGTTAAVGGESGPTTGATP